MSASLVPDEVQLSSEVLDLAAKLGVTAELPKVLEMTREVFSDAWFEVEAYQDHEIATESWIVIVVHHAIDNPNELMRVTSEWHSRKFGCCPAHLAWGFSIDTDWRP